MTTKRTYDVELTVKVIVRKRLVAKDEVEAGHVAEQRTTKMMEALTKDRHWRSIIDYGDPSAVTCEPTGRVSWR